MGIYGNGRFFETLLIRLQAGNLAELRQLGGEMRSELAKVIPSFLRRANPEHRHFSGFAAYDQALSTLTGTPPPTGDIAGWGDQQGNGGLPEVALRDWDPQAPEKVLAALYFPTSGTSMEALRNWAGGLSSAEQTALCNDLAGIRENRRHKPPRALELAFYTFDLVGDFGMYRDLHRHRMLTQQRQPLTTRHGHEIPDEVREAGLEPRFRQAMEQAAEAFETIAAEFPLEAQYVVPMAFRIRWQMHINLRALIWLVELRSSPQGHPAYRRMAQELYHNVARAHPQFAALFKFVDLNQYQLGRMDAEQRLESMQAG